MARHTRGRIRTLLAISAFGPALLSSGFLVWDSANDGDSSDFLPIVAVTLVLFLISLFAYRKKRAEPHSWWEISSVGLLAAFCTVLPAPLIGDDDLPPTFVRLGGGLLLAGIAVLPILTARRLINPSLPDLADSALTMRFSGRGENPFKLIVSKDTIELVDDSERRNWLRVSYPLADVESVAVWTEGSPTEWSITGEDDRTVVLSAGEILGVRVHGGVLTFDPAEPQKVRRFIEARVALAREAAADR